jgi:acyl carrier protein
MARPQWQPGIEIYSTVSTIVSEVFDVPECELTPDTHFVDDLDESLELAATIAACEEEFGLEIPDNDAKKLETVGLLANYIERQFQPDTEVWPPAPQRHRTIAPDTYQ